MRFKEGCLVVVLGSLKLKNYSKDDTSLIIGTYVGDIGKDEVQVLLPDGYIFTGSVRDICLAEEQVPLSQPAA